MLCHDEPREWNYKSKKSLFSFHWWLRRLKKRKKKRKLSSFKANLLRQYHFFSRKKYFLTTLSVTKNTEWTFIEEVEKKYYFFKNALKRLLKSQCFSLPALTVFRGWRVRKCLYIYLCIFKTAVLGRGVHRGLIVFCILDRIQPKKP